MARGFQILFLMMGWRRIHPSSQEACWQEAVGRNEGRGCVENVVVVLLRRVWPSKLIGIGMYS